MKVNDCPICISVTSNKIALDSVENAQIKDAEASNAELANGAITSDKTQDGSITSADLAAGAAGPGQEYILQDMFEWLTDSIRYLR